MIEQFKRRFNSLYWHQFALTAGMVLLTLLLLGVSFFTLSYGTTTADKRGEMRTRAELIAQVSADYFAAAGDASIDEGTALRKLADMASRMTDVDFLICSAQGNVLLTTDEELVGRSITIPQDIVDNILGEKALYQGRSNINGTYSVKKFAVAVPVLSSESQLVGIVLAVMDESEIMQVWRSFIGMFLMTSAIILLISFLASSVTSMRQIKPITDMVQATRAYAAGDFDVRIPELDRSDEIGELAQSFNAMADSLAETERQRRDFIANVSHELKTPLQSIMGSAELMQNGLVKPEDMPVFLNRIHDEAARLVSLIEDIIRLSQLDEGVALSAEPVELLPLAEETVRGLHDAAEAKNVTMTVTGENVTVRAARRLLSEILYNLCDNAIKYNVPGGSVTVDVGLCGESAVLTVADTGIGIPPEHQARVFERFYRVDKSHSRQSGGTGLGLSIVKHAVGDLGGGLHLDSTPGQGTTIRVTVPLEPQEE